jgi:arylformamidase
MGQLPLDRRRHFGSEIHPDDGTGRVPVRYRLAQPHGALTHPSRVGAVAWVYRNAARFDGDPNRLYIGGQSSGGHLSAVALTTDWQSQFNLPFDIIKSGMCISGMYDLTPVRLSARSRYVAFDDATVAALSPLRHLDRLHAPLVVAYTSSARSER